MFDWLNMRIVVGDFEIFVVLFVKFGKNRVFCMLERFLKVNCMRNGKKWKVDVEMK